MENPAPTSLVIDARKLVSMKIDGPALKIVMQDRSPVLFPLRRLRRIHILGVPRDGLEALLVCAENHIPIAFFDGRGRFRCRLHHGETGQPALLDHWFEYVEFDPEVKRGYEEWLTNQIMHAISVLGVSIGANGAKQQLLVDMLRRYCRERLGREQFTNALEWLEGLLRFHLEQVIEECGFRQHRARTKLINDLKRITDLWVLHALTSHLEQSSGERVTANGMIALYQRRAPEFEYALRRMLMQLVNRLESLV